MPHFAPAIGAPTISLMTTACFAAAQPAGAGGNAFGGTAKLVTQKPRKQSSHHTDAKCAMDDDACMKSNGIWRDSGAVISMTTVDPCGHQPVFQ
ncbi:MAG: hypothetical protein ACJARE_000903 [Paracoccaceae bacterium]|jgi:hypothetical protein